MALPTLPLALMSPLSSSGLRSCGWPSSATGTHSVPTAGINHDLQNWKLTWARSRKSPAADLQPVRREGRLPFNWTPPGETKALKFVCESYGFRYPFGRRATSSSCL